MKKILLINILFFVLLFTFASCKTEKKEIDNSCYTINVYDKSRNGDFLKKNIQFISNEFEEIYTTQPEYHLFDSSDIEILYSVGTDLINGGLGKPEKLIGMNNVFISIKRIKNEYKCFYFIWKRDKYIQKKKEKPFYEVIIDNETDTIYSNLSRGIINNYFPKFKGVLLNDYVSGITITDYFQFYHYFFMNDIIFSFTKDTYLMNSYLNTLRLISIIERNRYVNNFPLRYK